MNLSNDIMFKAVSAFVDALSDGIADDVEMRVKARMELFEDRMLRLTDRFDKLETASDERIEEIAKNVLSDDRVKDVVHEYVDCEIGSKRDFIGSIVDSKLDDYDPTDVTDFSRAVDAIIDDYDFGPKVKDVIQDDMKFEVTVV